MFSLLYKVFYDRTVFNTFVKNARGLGFKLIFLLSIVTCLTTYFTTIRFLGGDTLPNIATELAQDMPEIVIENGKIISPANIVIKSKDNAFILDTRKIAEPVFSITGKDSVYVTTTNVFVRRNNEIQRFDFSESLAEVSFVLNKNTIGPMVHTVLDVVKGFLIPLFLFIFLPLLVAAFLITTFIYALVSYIVTHFMKKKFYFDERMRLSALSIMPAQLISLITLLFGINIHFNILNFIITIVYMVTFIKDSDNTEIPENIAEVIERKNDSVE